MEKEFLMTWDLEQAQSLDEYCDEQNIENYSIQLIEPDATDDEGNTLPSFFALGLSKARVGKEKLNPTWFAPSEELSKKVNGELTEEFISDNWDKLSIMPASAGTFTKTGKHPVFGKLFLQGGKWKSISNLRNKVDEDFLSSSIFKRG